MASSLFGNDARIDTLKRMVGGNPDAYMQRMMQTNPQFAEFVNTNRNKTPEQIAADYGLDIGLLRRFM